MQRANVSGLVLVVYRGKEKFALARLIKPVENYPRGNYMPYCTAVRVIMINYDLGQNCNMKIIILPCDF